MKAWAPRVEVGTGPAGAVAEIFSCLYLIGFWERLFTRVRLCERLSAAPSESVGGIELSWYVLDIKANLFHFVQPAGKHSIDVPLSAEPCDRLNALRRTNEVRANVIRPRRPAAEQVVAEYAQGVDHGKQLQAWAA